MQKYAMEVTNKTDPKIHFFLFLFGFADTSDHCLKNISYLPRSL